MGEIRELTKNKFSYWEGKIILETVGNKTAMHWKKGGKPGENPPQKERLFNSNQQR